MKEIRLTQGKVALVDDEDFDYLNQFYWGVIKSLSTFYAVRTSGIFPHRKTVRMHRLITNCPKGLEVDHIDGDGLNNQKSNLRVCTKSENQRNTRKRKDNTSGYKGVSWHKGHKKYTASIFLEGKLLYLGDFELPEDAARAYDEAAIKYYREFANLNFPKENYKNE